MRETYTEDEIILMYKNADEQLDRVKLLSELSNRPKNYIIKLLNKHGINTENESRKARNDKKLARFIELYDKGWKIGNIALEIKISTSTLYNWRKENNLIKNKKSRPAVTETV